MSPGFIERLNGKDFDVTRVEAGKEENIVVAKVRCDPIDSFTDVTPNVPPHLIVINKYSSEDDKLGIVIKTLEGTAVKVRSPQVVKVSSPLLDQTYIIRHQIPDRKSRMGDIPRQPT